MKIQFLGGVQTVTGSKTLLTLGKHRILVDCGLFQGLKNLRTSNWAPLPVDPRQIDSVLLTHAHLDHTGYLPRLVKDGFKGKIYCSAPTRDLTELLLRDSAKIQEEDAAFANRQGYSKHHPAEPLYTQTEARVAVGHIERVPPGVWTKLPGKLQFRLTPSSHILGSTYVEVEGNGIRVAFSGDVGRTQPLLYPPSTLSSPVDYLVVESTYGDRTHLSSPAETTTRDQLARIINETYTRGGQIIIPAFAIGRAQEILFLISELKEDEQIPRLPIYLDSPMGVNATNIFGDYAKWHRLSPEKVDRLVEVAEMITTQQESIRVMREGKPAIIIAGSGMMTGGRVLHHLAARLPEDRNTIVLVGYQAIGTRGRLLKDGATELKMHGRYIPVRAHVEEIAGLSGHADQAELLSWLGHLPKPPKLTFVNHGEPQAADVLRLKIQDLLHWPCAVPLPLQKFDLN